MDFKYMRIQGREISYVTKYPKGVFSLSWNLVRDGNLTDDEKAEIVAIDDWFKANLPEPAPCVNHEKVIAFFKCASADEMYGKIEPIFRLLEKYHKPYDVVYTNHIGTVVYEDKWQIVVKVEDGKMV